MNKKLLSLFASTALVVPTLSFAVGLGSVRTYSHLNERLQAEIPVLSVKKKGKMTVSLAPNAEFSKRGVQRSEILSELKFALVERSGRFYVNVSSKKQVAVPYLNFILRLNTPEGVVSREYAIFLDPASNSKKKPLKRGKVASSPYRLPNYKKSNIRDPQLARQKKSKNVDISSAKGGKYGPIRKGETLWSIASHTRPSNDISVAKMVKAIRRANPKTLSRGLPAGVMINIPTLTGYEPYAGGYAPMPASIGKKNSKISKKKPILEQESQIASTELDAKKVEKKIEKNVSNADTSLRPEISSKVVGKKENTSTLLIDEQKEKNYPNEEVLVSKEVVSNLSEDKKDSLSSDKVMQQENDDLMAHDLDKPLIESEHQQDHLELAEKEISAVKDLSDDLSEENEASIEVLPSSATINESISTSEIKVSATSELGNEVSSEMPKEQGDALVDLPQIKETQPVAKKPAEKVKEPVTVAAPTPKQEEKEGLVDKAIEFAPFIGGGLAVVGLGAFLLNRRRKAQQEDIIPLTEENMAELLGEDSIDDLQSLEDDLIDSSGDMPALSENTIEDLDDEFTTLTEEDDVFSELNELVAKDDAEDSLSLNLEEDIDELSVLDLNEEVEELPELNLGSEIDDSLIRLEDDLSDDAVELDSVEATTPEEIVHLSDESDEELLFDLDDEENLFEELELTENNSSESDKESELDNSLSFDLSDGDEEDLFTLDDDLAAVKDSALDQLDFDLELYEKTTENQPVIESGSPDVSDELEISLSDDSDDLDNGLEFLLSDDASVAPSPAVTEAKLAPETPEKLDHVSTEKSSSMQMKLDLANSFISISDGDRAKKLLVEIINNGNDEQIAEAKELLESLDDLL